MIYHIILTLAASIIFEQWLILYDSVNMYEGEKNSPLFNLQEYFFPLSKSSVI
jgi:hypothetical protein